MAIIDAFGIGQDSLFSVDPGATSVLLGPLDVLLPILIAPPPQTDAGYEVTMALAIPAGAVMSKAVLRVAASAPGNTTMGKIASVRAASGPPDSASTGIVLDFGTMRTVSGVSATTVITSITPWNGTAFDSRSSPSATGVLSQVFQELQTERLLLTFDDPVSPADIGQHGGITTTTPPADLEVLVAGTRAWFRQGAVPAGFTQDVDVTEAVQAAVAAGTTPVPVVLRARVPGTLQLSLAQDLAFLRTHIVDFGTHGPEGQTTLDAAEEGIVDVALPLPAEATTWKIHRVVATVQADDRGPIRVQPPIGPAALADAELVIDPDRRITALPSRSALARFDTLTGVRVRLQPTAAGIEIGGGVLGGDSLQPGAAVAGHEITPVTLPGASAASWVTLLFAKPLRLPAKERVWLSLSATRGAARLGLADAPAATNPEDDETHEVTLIRRIAPNGIARPMSTAGSLRTDALALRLVGTAPEAAPIPLVEVGVASVAGSGSSASATAVPTHREPADDASRFSIGLDSPGPVAAPALRVVVTASTRLTIGPVVIAYEEAPA